MEIKERILSLIENAPQLNKAAFYSDPYVEKTVEELHRRWEQANYEGEPIDYATPDELNRLLELAEYYVRLPFWKAYKIVKERTEKGSAKSD
ncbi:hypothetical protein PYJP_09830 [Pyrofollis japonicus]|uniref:hypothetical protein n=1 Tax=Pyrofollis japonicus TaxID=3060460 RepID=UPI00295B6071|nr:hypothetical protein [Pyrofollis japonicus]BEP17631.1 hypothetical protein PYJP_09830 [Pyrofollis japonicus]